MKQLFFFIFFFLSLGGFAQETPNTEVRGFYVGVSFSPDYCYVMWTKNDDNMSESYWAEMKELLDSFSVAKAGFTTGFNFGYQFNNLIGIESGVQYSNKGFSQIPGLTFYSWGKALVMAKEYFRYNYVDIPFKVNFTFLKKKLQIVASAGGILNYLCNVKTKIVPESPSDEYPIKTTTSESGFNKFNFSPTIGAGIKYNLNGRMNLIAEPTFRYELINNLDDYFATAHLWSVGLHAGFNYTF